jgi:uncharacterized protein
MLWKPRVSGAWLTHHDVQEWIRVSTMMSSPRQRECPIATPGAPSFPKRPRLLSSAVGLAVAYLLLVGCSMVFEERLIFFPSRYPSGDWHPVGLQCENVEFATQDGVRLHGWYCPVPYPRCVFLMAHGNAGNITHRVDRITSWQQSLNVSVFVFDYRGYGRSDGQPNEPGVYNDARAAYRWVTADKGIAPEDVVFFGESLGTAVVLQLAMEVPPRALILESPLTSAVEVGQRAFPWLPVRWIMRNRFASIEKIGRYHGPLLIIHGTQDTVIPFAMGQTLFDRANEPKRFYPVGGADHNEVAVVGGRRYMQAMDAFLREVAGK